MKYKHTFYITAITALLSIMSPVMAEKENIPGFDNFDINQDGLITKKEASQIPAIANHYYGADLDNDGKLNKTEYNRVKKHLENHS
jgi:Ca2+-binding EF-hand superfamily protein